MPFCCATCFPDLSSLQVYTDDTLSKILRILQNNDTLSSGFRRRRRITNFLPLAKNIMKQNLHICYSTNKELLYLMLHLKSSRGSLFKATTCIQQTWVKISLVPVWVIGGGRKGIWPELLPCTSKSPTLLVGMPKPLNKGGESVTTSLMLQLVLHIFSVISVSWGKILLLDVARIYLTYSWRHWSSLLLLLSYCPVIVLNCNLRKYRYFSLF